MDRPHGATRYRRGPDENGNPGKGCRCATCRDVVNSKDRHRRRMIAYGRWNARQDATGTRRRLQALMRCGYSLPALAVRLGCTRQELRVKLHDRGSVTGKTARAVAVLYDELWDQPPPERTHFEKISVSRTRAYARKHGFPPPLAWDDDTIDNPGAGPADGWERGEGREWRTLAEEALDLLGFGLGRAEAAERLGVSRSTLSTTLARARKQGGENGDVAA